MNHQLAKENSLGEVCRFSGLGNEEELKNLLKFHKPFIVKDLAKSWPAFNKWNLDYMLTKEKNSKVWVRDGMSNKQTIEPVPFTDFIQNLKENSANNFSKKNLYLVLSRIMSHSNARSVQLPNLLQDIVLPSFIPIERLWEINLWIGAGGNRSGLHFDPEENLLFPIKGEKKIILISRSDTKNIYQRLDGQNILESKLDIFNIDKKNFPRIDNVKYYQTVIYPGEALYIPSGWWHAVESTVDTNISVNIWWLPNFTFLFKFPTCRRLWQKKEKWWSVLFPFSQL